MKSNKITNRNNDFFINFCIDNDGTLLKSPFTNEDRLTCGSGKLNIRRMVWGKSFSMIIIYLKNSEDKFENFNAYFHNISPQIPMDSENPSEFVLK